MKRLTIALLACLAPLSPAGATPYVFVSVSGENRIATYSMDAGNGTLKPAASIAVEGSPGALTTDPKRQFLFASLRESGKLASFRIQNDTGELGALSTVSVEADPSFLATDNRGRFLVSAYYRAGKVAVHRTDAGGEIRESDVQWTTTAPKAHAVAFDRRNRFVFVPHTGPEAIYQFRFDSGSGRLRPNSPSKIITPSGYGPRHLVFHPTDDLAYGSNEQGGSVSVYRLEPRRGTLLPVQTLSTLPDGFTEGNACADIEITPDGKFVYVSNRGHDSIAGFSTSRESGLLHTIGQTETEKTPRSFNIDPTGTFLYAAGQGSGKLAAFRIDQKSGALQRFATYDVGAQPWWVLVVEAE